MITPISKQVGNLVRDRQTLVNIILDKGVYVSDDDTYTDLADKVLDIVSPAAAIDYLSVVENTELTKPIREALVTVPYSLKLLSPNRGLNYTFEYCSGLTSIPGIDQWVVTGTSGSFKHTFNGCSSLVSLNLLSWDVEYPKDVSCMFRGCSSLTELRLGFKTLAHDNGSWTPTTAVDVFDGCTNLSLLDMSNLTYFNYWGDKTGATDFFSDLPTSCTILVKDQAALTWFNTYLPSFTDVRIKGV